MAHKSFFQWALPGIVFSVSFAFAACSDAARDAGCPAGTSTGTGTGTGAGTTTGTMTTTMPPPPATDGGDDSGAGDQAPGGTMTSSADGNTFDHFNDPGADGNVDPFAILQQRAAEGPPEIRTRMHSCTKVAYVSLGNLLTSLGVDLTKTSSGTGPQTAGELYTQGGDAYGVAKYDAREAETYFHTTASATKLFDIFVQAAPEIIANIATQPACMVNGAGSPMFDPSTGKCVFNSLSCIMGRPATANDLTLCDLILAQAAPGDAADLTTKQNITVATFLSAAHTCE
jgi:hypothetical protein